MPAGQKLTGQCMCGAVKITATAAEPSLSVCHCDMCRRWSSGPFMEVTCQSVSFEGEDNIRRIRSSDWAERAFCTKCGSNLFYQAIGSPEYQISAGLMNDLSDFQMMLQVFTDSKPHFYNLANKTEMMTAAEVFAKFAPQPE